MRNISTFIAPTLSLIALSATAAELEWNGTFNDKNGTIVRIDRSGVWSPDQTPTSEDNITFNHDSSTHVFNATLTGGNTLNANNITYNLTGVKAVTTEESNGFDSAILLGTGAKCYIAGNLTFNITKDTSETRQVYAKITAFPGVFNVAGDVIINANDNAILRFNDVNWDPNASLTKFYIGGNLVNQNNGNFAFSCSNITVAGIIDAGDGEINLAEAPSSSTSFNSGSISVGGIKATSDLLLTKVSAKDTLLTFTNKVDAEYKGGLLVSDSNVGKLSVKMAGEDNGTRQIMRITESETKTYTNRAYQPVNLKADGFVALTVESGRIDVGFFNGKNAGKVALNGGTLSAIGETTEAGTLDAESFTWSGGDIVVDIESATSADKIIASSFDKGETLGDISITFNISKDFDIKSLLENDNELTYFIVESSSGTFSQEDADRITLGGLDDGIDCKIDVVDNSLVATFTSSVPEPATVAGILGVIALAFAIRRRK